MANCVRSEVIKSVSATNNLMRIDLAKRKNILPVEDINDGFGDNESTQQVKKASRSRWLQL